MIVTPHSTMPVSGLSFPAMISMSAVTARGSRDRKATLSPFSTAKEILLNSVSPFTVVLSESTASIFVPASREGWKMMPGYLRIEGLISSILSFSSIFLRLVVCFDLATFALKRWMNSSSSFFFSSAFLFWFANWRAASWLDSYQKL